MIDEQLRVALVQDVLCDFRDGSQFNGIYRTHLLTQATSYALLNVILEFLVHVLVMPLKHEVFRLNLKLLDDLFFFLFRGLRIRNT